ncbi:hypothetical protein V8C86DRAFT_2748876 [Haematococcus lacustris]
MALPQELHQPLLEGQLLLSRMAGLEVAGYLAGQQPLPSPLAAASLALAQGTAGTLMRSSVEALQELEAMMARLARVRLHLVAAQAASPSPSPSQATSPALSPATSQAPPGPAGATELPSPSPVGPFPATHPPTGQPQPLHIPLDLPPAPALASSANCPQGLQASHGLDCPPPPPAHAMPDATAPPMQPHPSTTLGGATQGERQQGPTQVKGQQGLTLNQPDCSLPGPECGSPPSSVTLVLQPAPCPDATARQTHSLGLDAGAARLQGLGSVGATAAQHFRLGHTLGHTLSHTLGHALGHTQTRHMEFEAARCPAQAEAAVVGAGSAALLGAVEEQGLGPGHGKLAATAARALSSTATGAAAVASAPVLGMAIAAVVDEPASPAAAVLAAQQPVERDLAGLLASLQGLTAARAKRRAGLSKKEQSDK